jgi:PAS domain S-box-containing protein
MDIKTKAPKHKPLNKLTNTEVFNHDIDLLHDCSILTLNNELKISSWGSGSKEIFGYGSEDVIGQPFEILFTEDDVRRGIPKRDITKVSKEGRATANRWHIAKNGSLFYTNTVMLPLIGSNNDNAGYVIIFRNATEGRKTEEAILKYILELEELNRHKENVLAIISHDLRSPLASIIQLADFLNDYYHRMQPDEIQQMLLNLRKSSVQELKMLDYLVEWARIKQAAGVYAPKSINLSKITLEVFDSLKESASGKSIIIEQDVEESISVFADSRMLFSILHNIITNAIKHTRKEGSISVSATRDKNNIVVTVKDTGVGMTQEQIKNLFKPEINTLIKTRKNYKGAGIGLLLVKEFVEKNDGEIWVESVKGNGSSFNFTLPRGTT